MVSLCRSLALPLVVALSVVAVQSSVQIPRPRFLLDKRQDSCFAGPLPPSRHCDFLLCHLLSLYVQEGLVLSVSLRVLLVAQFLYLQPCPATGLFRLLLPSFLVVVQGVLPLWASLVLLSSRWLAHSFAPASLCVLFACNQGKLLL